MSRISTKKTRDNRRAGLKWGSRTRLGLRIRPPLQGSKSISQRPGKGRFESLDSHVFNFGLRSHSKARRSKTQARKKRAQRSTSRVRRPPGGMGVFHTKGWGSKSFLEFCRDVTDPGGVQKFVLKSSCSYFGP